MKKCFFVIAEKMGFDVLRADLLNDSGKIDDTVVQQLEKSDLVIIDLTKLNPNVMFEFGIRYGIKKPFVVIAQNVDNLPLDVRNIRVLEYTVVAPDIESINSKLEAMITVTMDNKITQEDSGHRRGYELGEELALQAAQSGDFSQIQNILSIADKLGINYKNQQ